MRRLPALRAFDWTAVSKVFVSLLFLTALAATIPEVLAGDGSALATSAPAVFLTGVVAVGVLQDVTDTRSWQLVVFGGLTVITLGQYAESGDWFDLLLVVGSAGMVLGLAFDAFGE